MDASTTAEKKTADQVEEEEYRALAQSALESIQILDAILDAGSAGEAELFDEEGEGHPLDLEELGLDESADVIDALNSLALSLSASARLYIGMESDIEGVTIVWGTGGPHVESVISSSGRATNVAYGWFESNRVEIEEDGFSNLFDFFAQLFEEMR